MSKRVILGMRGRLLSSNTLHVPTLPQIPVTPAQLLAEKHSLAAVIDHTLLKPEATALEIEVLCDEALAHRFASVCTNPCWVTTVHERLKGSPVKACSVVGFPLGANTTPVKMHEAAVACNQGAAEIDMVMNIGGLRSGHYHVVYKDIADVAAVVKREGGLLKVILETCLLTGEEKIKACQLAVEAGADYVKTSTGFSTGGATVEDVRLMRNTVGDRVGVKASGGIRTLSALKSMLEAGATRIGASAGIAILSEIDAIGMASPAGSY